VRHLLGRLPRPLDPFRSFKVKVALLVGLSLATSGVAFWAGSSWPFGYALAAALVVALVVTQLLAHGMTSPLREMTAAARAMARGRYDLTVRATSRDEIGELASAFNQMSTDLAASDRYRRELIANVSHELRTPISALHAVLENVIDGVVEADPDVIRTALMQTERLGRLVSELLDLSRVDGGALLLAREVFAVRPFLQEAAGAAERPVRLRLDVVPTDLTADADPGRLHQVVTNLLDNAARHSPPDGEVLVSARQLGPDGGLLLEVLDNGPGIAPEERSRVFERFTRGGADDGGTGLGLAIAQWAVELHGGSIAVVGDRPGCRIRVTLPAA
jgi:signal transduction histidine kinase